MKSELVPQNGDPPIVISRDITIIGRREFCDVVIDDPSLSKRHCVIVRTDGLLMLRDLASTNGTKVNGQRVSWAALLPNDRLAIGRYKLKVYLGADNAPSPSENHAKQRGVSWAPRPTAKITAPSPSPPIKKSPQSSGGFVAPTPTDGLPVAPKWSSLDPSPALLDSTTRQEPVAPGDSDDEIFQIDLDD